MTRPGQALVARVLPGPVLSVWVAAANDATERLRALALRQALQHDFDSIVEASRSSNADDEHDPEGATVAFERAQVIGLLAQSQ